MVCLCLTVSLVVASLNECVFVVKRMPGSPDMWHHCFSCTHPQRHPYLGLLRGGLGILAGVMPHLVHESATSSQPYFLAGGFTSMPLIISGVLAHICIMSLSWSPVGEGVCLLHISWAMCLHTSVQHPYLGLIYGIGVVSLAHITTRHQHFDMTS